MFVKDIKDDFYNLLLGNRVLLLVHYDVDAVCTCKILQSLFKCDNILYTLIPVGGISELKTAYEENYEEIKYVVLVNCGGTIDLVDILQPEEEVVFFVLDSHKPTNVCNVYSDGQVRVVWKDEEEDIPQFDDIFREDDEEEDESSESRDNLEATLLRRRERRAWEEKRDKLMFDYTKFSYYGQPCSCTAATLCWLLSRVGVAVWWCACVGVMAAREGGCREQTQALLDTHTLHTRMQAQHNNETATICLEKDLWLPLYRMWSLENSLRYSPILAPKLKMHTRSGDMRLRKLLADTGVPLQQARQAYRSMDVCLRQCLLDSLEKAGEKLDELTNSGFLLKRKFCPTLAAHDMVYILSALLENEKMPREEGFSRALDALNLDGESDGTDSRTLGADIAKKHLQHISNIVTTRVLHLAGPFTYIVVQEGTAECVSVQGPLWLSVLARWCARAGVGSAGSNRPLLLCVTKDNINSILLGVPPNAHKDPHNLLGAAFVQAAMSSGCSVSLDYVESSVVTLPTAQRTQFLDALTHLLT